MGIKLHHIEIAQLIIETPQKYSEMRGNQLQLLETKI
jgi:hypothetical protein